MSFYSKFYEIEVRDEVSKEFTDTDGSVDDMMAGLHEIRARLSEVDPWLKSIHCNLEEKKKAMRSSSSFSTEVCK